MKSETGAHSAPARPCRLVLPALALAAVMPLTAEIYRLAPADGAEIRLKVYKTGFMRGKVHDFVFKRYAGEIDFDAANPENSSVKIAIEATGMVCEDTWVKAENLAKIEREGKEKILQAAKYPRILFRSTEIRAAADGSFIAYGLLTIRNRSEAVSVETVMNADRPGELRFDGAAVVALRDYGIKPPSAAFGAVGTKNEMDVSFRLTARRP